MEIYKKPLQFPLLSDDCELLTKTSKAAPFGKSSQTIVDLNVRKAWQIDSEYIQFHPSWDSVLDKISKELKVNYGVECKLHFYKMLAYNDGCHFKSHKDTLRDKNHISSLLISLPTSTGFEGGVLGVRDPSSSDNIQWDGQCIGNTASWCSFYTDCDHELFPITSGYRMILAYHVYQEHEALVATSISPPKPENPLQYSVVDIVKSALKLRPIAYISLTHKYGSINEPKYLKGPDRILYEMLKQSFGEESIEVLSAEVEELVNNYDGGDGSRELNILCMGPDAPYIFDTMDCQCNLTKSDPILYCDGGIAVDNIFNEKDEEYEYDEMPRLYFHETNAAFLFDTINLVNLGYFSLSPSNEYTGNEAEGQSTTYRVTVLCVHRNAEN